MNEYIDICNTVLKTNRLILRPWAEADLDDFYEYASVDGVGQMAGWTPHKTIEESKVILKHFIDGRKTFAIVYDGKVIGSVGIEEYNEKHYPELEKEKGREIGYVLSKDYWGHGIMPEAVQRVIRYLFDEIHLDFLLVGHFHWNHQSKRVIEKCGFGYIKTTSYDTRYDTTETSVEYILRNGGEK